MNAVTNSERPTIGMPPWHARLSPVHHHEPDCPHGAEIPEDDRIPGRGRWRATCEWCFDTHLRRRIDYQLALEGRTRRLG